MENAFHNTLNPKLWVNNDLKPEVSRKLKEIAEAFIDFLEVPKAAIKDIVITGSSASYNYTPYSDIDLHLLVDFDKVHKDCPIVGNFLISKKSEFNNNHDIFIYGVPVEVYAESIDNENVHNGLYSLKEGKWIDEPKKLKPVNNDVAVKAKYKELAGLIDEVADKGEAIELINKIKRMRKSGLSKEGEFSVENLVFKKLRNEGLIGKLMDIKKEGIDKELSLEEAYEGIINRIEEMLGTSTVAMAPYPIGGISVTTVSGKQRKGSSKSAMLNYKYTKQWGNKAIVETMNDIALICEAIAEVAGKPFSLRGERVTPDEWRKFMRERKLVAAKIAKDEGKKENSLKESLILEMGRHIKNIYPKMYSKYKNMKYIDTDYYPDMTQEEKDKVNRIKGYQKGYEDQVAPAEASGDKARENIIAGNIKRTQHQLQNLTKAQKAKIYKSMGKAINRRIQKDNKDRESSK